MQISKGFNGLSLTYYLIRPCSLILRSFSSPTFCSFTFFCLNIIFRTNPTDNLISQIPASMQYGSTAKYLTSELPDYKKTKRDQTERSNKSIRRDESLVQRRQDPKERSGARHGKVMWKQNMTII